MKRMAAFAALLVALAACSHDWDGLEPTGAASSAGGGAASSSGSGGSGASGSTGGSTSNAGGGSTTGPGGAGGGPPLCGNRQLDPGEECDDGNTQDHDGCTGCVVDCDEPNSRKDPGSHHCYFTLFGSVDWMTARDQCQSRGPGTDLAAPSTTAELQTVDSLLFGSSHWTGGEYNSGWAWSNGEPWTYSDDTVTTASPPWSGADVPSHTNRCVVVDPGQTITAQSCGSSFRPLCERTPVP
ncbi:MAG TPA: lectin-like protein [Minicystis sp.]|nr:lectin-like protein [Minicystis sp.]